MNYRQIGGQCRQGDTVNTNGTCTEVLVKTTGTPTALSISTLTSCINGLSDWDGNGLKNCISPYVTNANEIKLLANIATLINITGQSTNQLISSINSATTLAQVHNAINQNFTNQENAVSQINEPSFKDIVTSLNQANAQVQSTLDAQSATLRTTPSSLSAIKSSLTGSITSAAKLKWLCIVAVALGTLASAYTLGVSGYIALTSMTACFIGKSKKALGIVPNSNTSQTSGNISQTSGNISKG